MMNYGCCWPDNQCQEPSYSLYPVPLCEAHGQELCESTEALRYREMIKRKLWRQLNKGIEIDGVHPGLMDFQAACVKWALRKGRAALWLATGLGKTYCELAFGYHVGGRVLLFAPLAVGDQMVQMAEQWLFRGSVHQIKEPSEMDGAGIWITNYQRAERFVSSADALRAVILDESSILKAEDGTTRRILTEGFPHVAFKLAATATPAPNDVAELANHSEFLGVLKRREMLAIFFVHDEHGWRLRGHAVEPFYRWLASWALVATSPTDLGCEHEAARFVLPSLCIRDDLVKTNWRRSGELFPGYGLKGITDRIVVRRASLVDRCMRAAEIIAATPDQFVVFCGLDDEQKMLARHLGEQCVSITGRDDEQVKISRYNRWRLAHVKTLLCKATMFGHGLNMQFCHNVLFLGMNDSFEQYYQAIRRCWRYQQEYPVQVWIVVTDHETAIVHNVRAKEIQWTKTVEGMITTMRDYMRGELSGNQSQEISDNIETREGDDWTLHRGDCFEVMTRMADDSVDLVVTSPPFLAIYTYSASEKDLGNSQSPEQFFDQYVFISRQLRRITKPGRLAAIHCQQVAATLVAHGYIGLQDFRGMLIRAHQETGWIYHGEVMIDKNPQAQAIRTHSKALLFAQKSKDASWLRPALADYILLFRKPGDNQIAVHPDVTNNEWIRLAHPVWYNIHESDTLNTAEGKDDDDERHIVPLQLETIENCVRLWSNPGDLVFDPFAGIGSTGYVALRQARRFVGAELKPRYWETAIANCQRARMMRVQRSLFDGNGAANKS